ncbi:hypothetical protein N476_20935 [Pseudoalteromonas luteoviolacea H33]|uniref:Uncharacterized protein n=1 Tax=Pseudoalteromonas luteoviolacea H33 TaxID=1365251 RepID=A0A167DH63_9GAMM|nr:hypothetical protein N476_20935 [Pseudoalteromonas luteoviolacea H33]KZN72848.1 hypothetical protein N477_24130 [Pseudoalteromonas luteoviolacea H33-S]
MTAESSTSFDAEPIYPNRLCTKLAPITGTAQVNSNNPNFSEPNLKGQVTIDIETTNEINK